MSLHKICLASLVVFCCAFVQPLSFEANAKAVADRPIADKWALIIGIDRFSDRRIPTLKYSAKDTRDFAAFLD